MIKKIFAKLGVHNKQDLKALIIQAFKFGIVGLSNTAVWLIIYYIFVYIDKDLYLIGNFVGFVVSVANAFFWNSRYVFKDKNVVRNGVFERIIRPLLKSYVAYGVTFLISQGLLYLLVTQLNVSEIIAPLLILIVTIPLNFLLNKLWTFK